MQYTIADFFYILVFLALSITIWASIFKPREDFKKTFGVPVTDPKAQEKVDQIIKSGWEVLDILQNRPKRSVRIQKKVESQLCEAIRLAHEFDYDINPD